VPSRWSTHEKTKGRGNRKNGDVYLAWADGEAAMLRRRDCPAAQRFYQRKAARGQPCVAHAAPGARTGRRWPENSGRGHVRSRAHRCGSMTHWFASGIALQSGPGDFLSLDDFLQSAGRELARRLYPGMHSIPEPSE
jgi:hypothetical protein